MALSSNRFAAPELLQIGPPPPLAAETFEVLLERARVDLVAQLNGAGIVFEVARLDANPAMRVTRSGVFRDLMRRQEIDEAVSQTYLGSATGAFLDQRAADYGVLRRFLPHTLNAPAPGARPPTVPSTWEWDGSFWREPDELLRTRARLAWEALSVAGPRGAYAFHAGEAHPFVVADATGVYGPETGLVNPGEVLVVVQADNATGVPSEDVVNSVAARLDAHEVSYSTGAKIFRQVRDEQSIRPLGARVIVKAVEPVPFYVSAILYIRPGPDPEVIRQTAMRRLERYLATRRRVGVEVPISAISAALHVADVNGLPVVEEVEVIAPEQDVTPEHDQLALVSITNVEVRVR